MAEFELRVGHVIPIMLIATILYFLWSYACETLCPTAESRFLSLPAELRTQIYELALAGLDTGEYDNKVNLIMPAHRYPGLVQTGSQMRKEALPIFYAMSQVILDNSGIGQLSRRLHTTRTERLMWLGLPLFQNLRQLTFAYIPWHKPRFPSLKYNTCIVHLDLVQKLVQATFYEKFGGRLRTSVPVRRISGLPDAADRSDPAKVHRAFHRYLSKFDFSDGNEASIVSFLRDLPGVAVERGV
ncbi:hypothetical protein MBLNU230_g2606t1 [Neophaeotheca triangularis]